MQHPSSEIYKEAKLVKLGGKKYPFKHQKIKYFLRNTYNITLLYVTTLSLKYDKRQRVVLVVEFIKDRIKLENINQREQGKLYKTILQYVVKKHRIEDCFLVVYDFQSVAMLEANYTTKKKHAESLIKIKSELWDLQIIFELTVFFFYTNTQLTKSINTSLQKEIANQYYVYLKMNDQFNYFNTKNYLTKFDSKENFETLYKGNWNFYYHS